MNNEIDSFIFGYGGLMLSESRSMTLSAEIKAAPVLLRGFERFWGFAAPQFRLTTVALRSSTYRNCAGVIFPVTHEQLIRLDQREIGYKRVAIQNDDLTLLNPQGLLMLRQAHTYTYVIENESSPDQNNPIVQSDVDAILTGCLKDFGEEFAKEVIRTTSGWEGSWFNDRAEPRYPWSFHNSEYHHIIDNMLKRMTPIDIHHDKKRKQ